MVAPKLLELNGTDEGEDRADEEADEGHDRQRVGTGLLHQEPEVAGAKPGLPAQQAPEGERDLAEEAQELVARGKRPVGRVTGPDQQRSAPTAASRIFLFRHGFGEPDESVHAFREAVSIDRHRPRGGILEHAT